MEVDEAYVGGKRNNMVKSVREEQTGRGPIAKTVAVGTNDRVTNRVATKAAQSTD